jgi:hypothetical protein
VIINVCCYSCKISIILVRFKKKKLFNFLDKFSKGIQILNFVKICPVGVELFHADGRTDIQVDSHDEATSRFSQFCESI